MRSDVVPNYKTGTVAGKDQRPTTQAVEVQIDPTSRLRSLLFEAIEGVRDKRITAHEAGSVAALASQLINLEKLERGSGAK